jgi:hypothetical protein
VKAREGRGFGRWIRLHGFDGWQILGSACLVIGVLGFAVLIVQIRPTLARTHGAFLLETIVNGGHQPSNDPQPGTSASPSSSPDLAQTGPLPSASRSGLRRVSPSATAPPTGGATPSSSPSPSPTASPSDSPTPRPGVHPSPLPTPTPTPRPSVH